MRTINTAYSARGGLKFRLPNMLAWHATCDAGDAPRLSATHRRPFARFVEALGDRLRAAQVRSAATGELAAMSNCELADMGIVRSDVSRLFDAEFLREFRLRGGLPAGHSHVPK